MGSNNFNSTVLGILNKQDFNNRRTEINKLVDSYNESADVLTTQDTSDARKTQLHRNIDKANDEITYLNNVKDKINAQIDEIPDQASKLNQAHTDLTEFAAGDNFTVPNVQIKEIVCYLNTSHVVGITIKHTDNSETGYGIRNTLNGRIEENYQFSSTQGNEEYLTKIDIIKEDKFNIASALIFYTTNKINGVTFKGTSYVIPDSSRTQRKELVLDNSRKSIVWHYYNARKRGMKLVSINSPSENEEVKAIANGNNVWLGAFRKRPGRGKDGNTWRWLDRANWSYTNWNRGEPNDWGGPWREPLVEMYRNGKWNDIGWSKKNAAIYSKLIRLKNSNSISSGSLQIFDITFYPDSYQSIDIDVRRRRKENTQARDSANAAIQGVVAQTQQLNESNTNYYKEINNINKLIRKLESVIVKYNDELELIDSLLEAGDKLLADMPPETFANMNDFNIFDKINEGILNFKNILFNNNMREGLSSWDKAVNIINNRLENNAADELTAIDKYQHDEYVKYTTELLAKRDNILNNVLMDYMINEHEGTNVSQVYNKLDQNNTDKLRKININNYYTKTYKEYIYMVKIIIVMALILVPILILNNNYMLPHNITMFLVVTVIFVGVLYLGYRFYNLQMRDDKDFDKIRVPYDRTAVQLAKDGKIKNKPNILNSLGITCIGDECCDASMVYDNLRNKCIMQENFGNAFETINANQGQITYVSPCDLHDPLSNYSSYEGFVNTNSDKEGLKVELLTGSLSRSSTDKFTKFPQDFSRIE